MEEESEYTERESRPKMSMTPSWVMLGFILGALFVVALPPLKKPAAPPSPPAKVAPAAPAKPSTPPQISTIEAVFSVWGDQAVWDADTTEVALWNPEKNLFSDFYEVRRVNGVYYFRSIPKLTRPIIRRGKDVPERPLQFTETEEQYREWQKYGRTERPPSTDNR